MKTRSQTKAEERSSYPCIRNLTHRGELSIAYMKFTPAENKYTMGVRWPDGKVSEHDRQDIYVKNPQEVIKFYESCLQVPVSNIKTINNTAQWRLVLSKEERALL
ncbi:hypothetical protein QL093DRAFT_2527050, partial [Fusarium oxysporum]